MKQRIELNVEAREAGRATARGLRVNKMVPAVIYGSLEPVTVSLHVNDVLKYNTRNYENALMNLKSSNSKLNGKIALFKEVVVNPVTRIPEHVDLFALDMTKTVRVSIEIKIEGKAIGLSEGGLLNVVTRQVEVECLPTNIPESIIVDVTNLAMGDSIHAAALKIPDGIKLLSRPELTIVAVVEQEEEVVAAPVAAAAAAPAAAAGGKAAAAAPAAAAGAKAPAAKAPAKK
jgi:large subunit ribosomal protein L25